MLLIICYLERVNKSFKCLSSVSIINRYNLYKQNLVGILISFKECKGILRPKSLRTFIVVETVAVKENLKVV
jgi:hypothetical protein